MKRKIYKAGVNPLVGTAELVGTFLRVINGFHFRGALPERRRDKALVLGNGPSLRDDLPVIEQLATSGVVDLWCVNNFASSEAYLRLEPTNYVIADPAYWEDDTTELVKAQREALLQRLLELTRWEMVLHVPYTARGTAFATRLEQNKHIRLRFFNQTAVNCPISALRYWLYRHELAMPHPQNVLIPSLYLAIVSGYEKVGIVGADHSWHRDILVRDRMVMLRDPHFYDDDTEVRPFYKNATETWTMAEIFTIWAKVFTQYELLSGFARSMRVNVVNSSSVSYIDSLKSLTLSQF